VYIYIYIYSTEQSTAHRRHFIWHARARIHRFSSQPPRGHVSSRIHCTSNRSSIDCNFFQKLLPLETEASILWRLAISPPPNCSPPPLLAVTYVMAPQDIVSSSGVIPPQQGVLDTISTENRYRLAPPTSLLPSHGLAATFRTTRASAFQLIFCDCRARSPLHKRSVI
jgi:hypothetical protein